MSQCRLRAALAGRTSLPERHFDFTWARGHCLQPSVSCLQLPFKPSKSLPLPRGSRSKAGLPPPDASGTRSPSQTGLSTLPVCTAGSYPVGRVLFTSCRTCAVPSTWKTSLFSSDSYSPFRPQLNAPSSGNRACSTHFLTRIITHNIACSLPVFPLCREL